jgi:hypothetical protein
MERIKKTYAADCQRLIAPEVNAGDTIADNITQAQADIKKAEGETASAIKNFDKAFVLTSRDDLTNADGSLKSAQAHLDGITKAETLLGQKQTAVEGELKSLEGRYASTRSNAGNVYVRKQAKSLLAQGEQTLRQADGVVKAQVKNPFAAKDAIGSSESSRTQVETAIAADKRAYDTANSSISNAESEISRANAQILAYAAEDWHFSNRCGSASGSVGRAAVGGALAELVNANSLVSEARGLVSAQRYEDATSVAGRADSSASRAVSLGAAARAAAYASFESRKRQLESQQRDLERREAEERRRQEEAAAARRRAEEARRSSSSSGSRGGGFGGGGGSGSRGGSW